MAPLNCLAVLFLALSIASCTPAGRQAGRTALDAASAVCAGASLIDAILDDAGTVGKVCVTEQQVAPVVERVLAKTPKAATAPCVK